MDDLTEVYYVENLEQMRTIADPRRMRIFERLTRQPMTVTQLGDDLGDSPAKIHYHVRELERIGVIKLVETREKGGILEKYYRAVAKSVQISPDLLKISPPDQIIAMIQEWFQLITGEGIKAIVRRRQNPETQEPMMFESSDFWATPDEFRQALVQMGELFKPYAEPRGIEGEREWVKSVIAHTVVNNEASVDDGDTLPTPPITPTPPLPPIRPSPLQRRDQRVFVVGALSFDRHALERAVAEGRQIEIAIIGVCHFANDIPANLVERAVRTFQHRGILQASPAVRAVLQRKGNAKDTNA